jgi:hypothetical protein
MRILKLSGRYISGSIHERAPSSMVPIQFYLNKPEGPPVMMLARVVTMSWCWIRIVWTMLEMRTFNAIDA